MTGAVAKLVALSSGVSGIGELLPIRGALTSSVKSNWLDRSSQLRPVTIQSDRISERPVAKSFDEEVFDSLVSLKVAVATYAMHLDQAERQRLFDELDSKLNVDDWHEGDTLPAQTSFVAFLKWMIFSKYFRWTSIGVSNDGNILVAWNTPSVLLTANFAPAGIVRWTAQVNSQNGEIGHSVGKCPLRLFSEHALFYLQRTS